MIEGAFLGFLRTLILLWFRIRLHGPIRPVAYKIITTTNIMNNFAKKKTIINPRKVILNSKGSSGV